MCAHNVFCEKITVLVLLLMFKNSKKSKFFCQILSSRRRFFTAYSVNVVGDFLPHTH
jgi:hypothetical protein